MIGGVFLRHYKPSFSWQVTSIDKIDVKFNVFGGVKIIGTLPNIADAFVIRLNI
jgi:hypothetical protein